MSRSHTQSWAEAVESPLRISSLSLLQGPRSCCSHEMAEIPSSWSSYKMAFPSAMGVSQEQELNLSWVKPLGFQTNWVTATLAYPVLTYRRLTHSAYLFTLCIKGSKPHGDSKPPLIILRLLTWNLTS